MAEWTSSGDHLVAGTYYENPAVANLAGGGYVVAWVSRGPGSGGDFTILAQRFDEAGYKVGGEMALNTEPITATMRAPRVAIDARADGGFVAAWTDDLEASGGSHFLSLADVYARWFDANGEAAGEPVLVNDVSLRTPGVGRAALDVVTLSTGDVAVAWSSTDSTLIGVPSTVFKYPVQIYDAGGSPKGQAFETAGRVIELLPLSEGFYAICIVNDANGQGWFTFQRFTPSGAAWGEPTVALYLGNTYNENFPSSLPAVAAALLSNGHLLLARAQTDNGALAPNVALMVYDSVSGQHTVKVIQLPDSGSVSQLKAVALDDGGFLLSWAEDLPGLSQTIVAQRFDAAANPAGERFTVTDIEQTSPEADYAVSVAAEDGVIFTWEVNAPIDDADRGIYIERFGPDVPPEISAEDSEQVAHLYVSMFGRAPDGEGLAFWAGLLREGVATSHVAVMMFQTEPARAYYPSGLSDSEIVSAFYVNVLGRQPDAEGLAFWTDLLEAPGASTGSVMEQIIEVVADYTGSDPAGLESAALFENRVTVAQYYGEHNASIAVATHALDSVTSNAATVDDAIAQLELMGTSAATAVDAYY